MASQVTSAKHLERVNTYLSKTIPKSTEEGKLSNSFYHHYPDTKTRQRYHKKRNLWMNITDEHRCKNPQQNTSKLTPTIHLKDQTP